MIRTWCAPIRANLALGAIRGPAQSDTSAVGNTLTIRLLDAAPCARCAQQKLALSLFHLLISRNASFEWRYLRKLSCLAWGQILEDKTLEILMTTLLPYQLKRQFAHHHRSIRYSERFVETSFSFPPAWWYVAETDFNRTIWINWIDNSYFTFFIVNDLKVLTSHR